VHVVGDIAYFSCDSFGLVAYRMADLVLSVAEYEPVVKPADQPEGVCATAGVTKLSAKQGGVECRPPWLATTSCRRTRRIPALLRWMAGRCT
ncbi:MAG: hypothetical protein R6X21_06345, partial [Candidatus Aminicenantes bacterium]